MYLLLVVVVRKKCKFIPKGMEVSLPLNNRWKEMLRIYRQKMFTSYCFGTKLYTKRQFSCHLIAGRNFKHLSLENIYLLFVGTKNK